MLNTHISQPRPDAPPLALLGRDRIPPLWPADPPTVQIALPDGRQARLPGVLWPSHAAWEIASTPHHGACAPIEIRQIKRDQSNALIERWGTHDLGPERRRYGYTAFALYVLGEPIAVATAATSHSASVDKDHGLARKNVIELTRLCRSEEPIARHCLRIMLRAWREYLSTAYWPYFPDEEVTALITYSMPGKPGHIYRTDGWLRLRGCKPWGGKSNWSAPSRTGSAPDALWVYWLGEHQRRPSITAPDQ